MKRREALTRMGGILGLGLIAPAKLIGQTTSTTSATTATEAAAAAAGKPFSIAHVTDIHLFDQLDAERWVAKAFHELQSHPSKPALILNTGDTVMDTTRPDRQESDRLWKLWQQTAKNEISIPLHSCLGNHDVWGLNHEPDSASRKDPMFGKKLGLDGMQMEKPYYSFNQGGWHFVMLDSIMPLTNGKWTWHGQLDDEQFQWLENDLQATSPGTPVIVCTHMPIIQVCTLATLEPNDELEYELTSKSMMADARKLIDLFNRHKNVKLCFSGHVHRLDRVELNGTTYICDGAMSGAKWKGNTANAKPGYAITTLHPDGSFDYKYLDFGWKRS